RSGNGALLELVNRSGILWVRQCAPPRRPGRRQRAGGPSAAGRQREPAPKQRGLKRDLAGSGLGTHGVGRSVISRAVLPPRDEWCPFSRAAGAHPRQEGETVARHWVKLYVRT